MPARVGRVSGWLRGDSRVLGCPAVAHKCWRRVAAGGGGVSLSGGLDEAAVWEWGGGKGKQPPRLSLPPGANGCSSPKVGLLLHPAQMFCFDLPPPLLFLPLSPVMFRPVTFRPCLTSSSPARRPLALLGGYAPSAWTCHPPYVHNSRLPASYSQRSLAI